MAEPSPVPEAKSRAGVIAALLTLYLVWGSTYLAIKVALEGFTPIGMCVLRFWIGGLGLYLGMRAAGRPDPTPRQWRHGFLVAIPMLLGGTGLVVVGEQWVDSGITALLIAATPLWSALLEASTGRWPGRRQTLGLGFGFVGVALLGGGGPGAPSSPLGVALLLLASLSWSWGSRKSLELDLPPGLMAPGVEMLGGAVWLTPVALAQGFLVQGLPGTRPLLALLYLTLFGSVLAFSAYLYLLPRVSPMMATSYAYVNPLVALLLGAWLGHEPLGPRTLLAAALVVVGVVLVASSKSTEPPGSDR